MSENPNLIDKAINFTKAVIEHAGSGFSKVDEATQQERLESCRSCIDENGISYYRENDGNPICNHKLCGCFLLDKTLWSTQRCPIGRWHAEKPISGSFNKKSETLIDKVAHTFPANFIFGGCCNKQEKSGGVE